MFINLLIFIIEIIIINDLYSLFIQVFVYIYNNNDELSSGSVEEKILFKLLMVLYYIFYKIFLILF